MTMTTVPTWLAAKLTNDERDQLDEFIGQVRQTERNNAAFHLMTAAEIVAPSGKRSNQFDRHTRGVLERHARIIQDGLN